MPTVTYTDLPQFIYGVASTASETFPLANSQPTIFRMSICTRRTPGRSTPTLTWTFGVRDTYNSNPLNPHDEVARLPGSFAAISHDVNQPLNAAIQTGLGNIFAVARRWPSCNREPQSPGSSGRKPCCERGFGLFSDLLPGSVAISLGANPPVCQYVSGRPAGHGRRLGDCARRAEQRGRRDRRSESEISCTASRKASCPVLRRLRIQRPVCRLWLSQPSRMASFMRPISCNGASLWNTVGEVLNLSAQYVGTRAVNQPYTTQVNGYQTVCPGCFRALSLRRSRPIRDLGPSLN